MIDNTVYVDGIPTQKLFKFLNPSSEFAILNANQKLFRMCLHCGKNRFSDEEWLRPDDAIRLGDSKWNCKDCDKLWFNEIARAYDVVFSSDIERLLY
jgi:hypothetical protein